MYVTEAETVGNLYKGLGELYKEEKEARLAYMVQEIERIKKEYPRNIGIACFNEADFQTYSASKKEDLLQIIQSGISQPTSHMGAYIQDVKDFQKFPKELECMLSMYHKIDIADLNQVNNWDISKTEEYKHMTDDDKKLDLRTLGLNTAVSMRVRTARNLEKYPLPAAMTKEDRLNMERDLYENVFIPMMVKKQAEGGHGGLYYTLTPENEFVSKDHSHVEFLTKKRYDDLVTANEMFKNMDEDQYLKDAGLARDWPYGRGMYKCEGNGLKIIVWVGEEDHMRIMAMKKGHVLKDVFQPLEQIVLDINQNLGENKAAVHPSYGVIASCPTNMGTGMRASLHLKLPYLTNAASHPSVARADEIAKTFGLQARGIGGEGTATDREGTIDLSPTARFKIQEAQVLLKLYLGAKSMLLEEKKLRTNLRG